jgi:Ca2+-binding EF-hand superfamily protein
VLRFFLKGSIISFLIVFIFIIDMDKLTQEEISEFREIFNLVDKDGGGSITKVELAELMDTLGIDASPEEIDAMISEIDQGMR